LEVQCFEVAQYCFDHVLELKNWKHLVDTEKVRENKVEDISVEAANKRRRLTDENDLAKIDTLKNFVEVITKPNVVNSIRKEILKHEQDTYH